MEKPKIEYAARTAFHEERSASSIPAHIVAQVERLNNTETRSSDDEENEDLPVVPRVLRYRL